MTTVIFAVFILILALKGPEETGKFIVDEDGNAVGIRRSNLQRTEQYDLELHLTTPNGIIVRDERINLQAESSPDDSGSTESGNDSAELEAEISTMITGIELSDEAEISLPAKLPDGTEITWRIRKENDSGYFIAIPVVYFVFIALLFKSRFDESGQDGEKERKAILRGLPRFCNQLWLMMNAGMILSDAFEQIKLSYEAYGSENRGFFEEKLVEIAEENGDHRKSTAVVISEFAEKYNVKELIRIATILVENERRGSDVIENLSRESRYLWDDRKIVAREYGKMIDTKMAYPLGLLLILLIVITMAPALLGM